MSQKPLLEKLKQQLSNFTKFRVKVWLDKKDKLSLYVIHAFIDDTSIDEIRYQYEDVLFIQYALDANKTLEMITSLNSCGYYKEDFFVNEKLIGILNVDDFEKLNPSNLSYRGFGNFYEGDNTAYYNINFKKPTRFIFFRESGPALRFYFSSQDHLFNKDYPFFPSKTQAFRGLMGLDIMPNQEDMFSGIMFFIPLSKFLINEVKIIGNKLQLAYNNRSDESEIGIKIYYEDEFSNFTESINEDLKTDYELSRTPTHINLIVHKNNEIIDKIVFDFDPRISPEKGRVKFILTSDYIQNLINGGENEEVEFKGFENIQLSTDQKDDLTETFVSFANIKGGVMIVGVKDDKTIIGFKQVISTEEIKKTLVDIIYDWCDPRIDFVVNEVDMRKGERLIIIHVNKGSNPPYMKIIGKTGIFLRINESDRPCTRIMFDEFMGNISNVKTQPDTSY